MTGCELRISEEDESSIIECMLVEVELLEMRHQVLVMQVAKLLHGKGTNDCRISVFNRIGMAYMEKKVNTHDIEGVHGPDCPVLKIT